MNFETLRFARFGLLDQAITDWSTLVSHLGELKRDANDGLRKQANKADWAGVNATVTKGFIGKTAHEFSDAHKQATSLRNILKDTRDELRTFHTKLDDILERARKQDLTVTATGGGGFMVSAAVRPPYVATEDHFVQNNRHQDVTAIRDEIQAVLEKATDVDHTASVALKALVDQADIGFTGAMYKDRDSAARAIAKGDRLAALAKKDPDDISVKEFDELNAGLKEFSGDELFAARFAEKLGARGTLEFWAGLNAPLSSDLLRARATDLDDLQENLSLTLATASQSDTRGMKDWKSEMVDLGSRPVSGSSGPLGFQVMSNLMRWGNYDDKFLQDYGSALIRTEKELTDNGRDKAWRQEGMDGLLNRTGTDAGRDPFTGFMKALANSPDAATAFFGETFVTKDEDHEFVEDADGNGRNERRELSNFEYLFEERDWPKELNSKGDDSVTGPNAMALALEAATTGHPAGEAPTIDTPPHSAQQAKLMEALVASISDDPERLTKRGYMSDSIGQITSEYLPDINRATADADEGSKSIPKLFPIAGTPADLSHTDVTRLLISLGQNPEGYSAVEVAQKWYLGKLMEYHLDPTLPDDQKYPHPAEDTVKEIARRSGEVGGSLAIGRQEGVLGEANEADGDFEHAVNQKKGLISGTVGTAVGVGTSFIASPAVGAGVGGAVGVASNAVLEQLFKDSEPEKLSAAGKSVGDLWEDSTRKNIQLARIAAEEAAKEYNSPHPERFEEWAREGTRDGFNDASTSARQMADDLETEIPGK
ncbi:hypothetical protein [Streptomyces sp. NPDC059452]|uniref:hypothetical protein n=1 Tax=Streptomyces sp. NPDC059452 TaxID=3346835 RepID=UPI003673E7B5